MACLPLAQKETRQRRKDRSGRKERNENRISTKIRSHGRGVSAFFPNGDQSEAETKKGRNVKRCLSQEDDCFEGARTLGEILC